jgi:hypothetical protein
MKVVEPGKWYLLVGCRKCSRPIPFQDVSEDPTGPVDLPTRFDRTCPACGHTAEYDLSEVLRSQGRYKQ